MVLCADALKPRHVCRFFCQNQSGSHIVSSTMDWIICYARCLCMMLRTPFVLSQCVGGGRARPGVSRPLDAVDMCRRIDVDSHGSANFIVELVHQGRMFAPPCSCGCERCWYVGKCEFATYHVFRIRAISPRGHLAV